ncbi:MAG: stage V sporulation protein D [Candidatus Doudnabacteria bacterium]
MSKQNRSPHDNFKQRINILRISLVLFAALIILRLFVISVGRHSIYTLQAENQHNFYQKINATRGQILITDRYSTRPYPLATNSHKDLVFVVPQDIKNPQAVSIALSKILGINQKDLQNKITDLKRKYVPLKKQLSEEESKAISGSKLAGVYLDQEDIRSYPEGNFLSQVLGFVGYKEGTDQKIGVYGIERFLQKELAGTPGVIQTEADKRGNWIAGSPREFTPAEDGTTIQLTIDRAIQFKAESVLKDAITKHGADSGSVIIADPKTGAILAMANYPSYDPNQFNKVTNSSAFVNNATLESYEPGSTMKAITMAAGLDMGVISPQTTYNDKGFIDIAGYKINNSVHKALGVVPMTTVLDQSLNTGAIFVEQQVGSKNFLDYLKKFGFGQPTNIELPESKGNLNNLKGNIQINYFTSAFGQGITVTPLQMLQSYFPLADGGKLMQPYIIDSRISSDGTITKTQPKLVRQVISPKAASLISGMLVDVVENGHGKQAAVKGYYIGGKTGTAQVASKGVYVQNDNIGSFLGYGPIEDPRFVMLVFVNHPRDVAYAESTAAPAFGEIAQFILNYYNIPSTRK